MIQGRPVKVHVLAEFACDRCGNTCVRMTTARLADDGRVISPAWRPLGGVICNECERRESDKKAKAAKTQSEQRAWARRANTKGATR